MVIILGHEEGEGALGQPHRPELPDLHPPCLGRWAMCSLPAATTPAGKAFFLATACGSSQAGDLTCVTAATRAAAVTTLDL